MINLLKKLSKVKQHCGVVLGMKLLRSFQAMGK